VTVAQGRAASGAAVVDAVIVQPRAQYGRWDYFEDEAQANIHDMNVELRGTKRIPKPAAPSQYP
jgi:hypothetical protein